MISRIEDAIKDLKAGKLIVVIDDENRENEGDLVGVAEILSEENLNFMISKGKGLVCVPLDEKRAKELNLEPMVIKNTDHHGTAFTVSVDSYKDTTTGISVKDRRNTILDLAKRAKNGDEFRRPGHIFPLIAKKGGVLERDGHTEAAVDLAKIARFAGVGVICEIIKDNGEMARLDDLKVFAEENNLKIITIKDLIEYRKRNEFQTKIESRTKLPTKYGEFEIVGFSNWLDNKEHIALVYGDIMGKRNVLTRVHSECLTGDVLGSLKCDCGNQLEKAMKSIVEKGEGVILYMRQEGRGIGLINKIKAYKLQNEGKDTIEANLLLGFEEDLREYSVSAQMLKLLGVKTIDLMTNNPKKIEGLEKYGVEIEKRIDIELPYNSCNYNYLKTKKEKMNHYLNLLEKEKNS